MTRRTPARGQSRKSAVRKIHEVFGEESASDDDDFQSVSTNNSATNYDLEFTGQTLKNTSKSPGSSKTQGPTKKKTSGKLPKSGKTQAPAKTKTSRSEQSIPAPSKSILKSPIVSNRRQSARTNPTVVQTRSPEANTSRVRFSSHPSYESSPGTSSRQENTAAQETSKRSQKSRAAPGSIKANRRKQSKPKSNSKVLREIREMQRAVGLLIPKLPFSRLIREILMQYSDTNLRVTLTALEAIQEAAELYLVQLFEDSYRCTIHRSRITLMVKDIELVRFLRGPQDVGNFQ